MDGGGGVWMGGGGGGGGVKNKQFMGRAGRCCELEHSVIVDKRVSVYGIINKENVHLNRRLTCCWS